VIDYQYLYVIQALSMIKYELPQRWMLYDVTALIDELTAAKAAVLSLKSIPYQRSWAEKLQYIQLKREVEGTSRIEGADFTRDELDNALKEETPEELFTRSQRQAHAALRTYQWIANLPDEFPVNAEMVLAIHRQIVTGADDDHCPPGKLRTLDQNVVFGSPKHRGAEGGEECSQAFTSLAQAVAREFKGHDPLIKALALHYHFASIHPFLDGNGRTARALEALMLQRAGLKGELFIAMSNYYYDQKPDYLAALAQARAGNHDLTEFLRFGLRGIESQCLRLFKEIKKRVQKALFHNRMRELFERLETKRRRVIAQRQMELLKLLLDTDEMDWADIIRRTNYLYDKLNNPINALVRDINHLLELGTIGYRFEENKSRIIFVIRLEWPTEITETEFFAKIKQLPKAKTHNPFQWDVLR
jgi:Fic family protein